MSRAGCAQRGFTLLELLVAIGVFAVMSIMAYGGLKTVLDSRQQTDAQAKRLAAVQLTFLRLERDIEQMTDRGIRDEYGDPQPPLLAVSAGTSGDDSSIFSNTDSNSTSSTFSSSSSSFNSSNTSGTTHVEFTHAGWSNPANEPRSTLQRVGYTLKDKRLLRAYWVVLDRAQDSQPIQTVMLDKVKSMEWRFLDNTGNWQIQWPLMAPTAAQAPPVPAAPQAPQAPAPVPSQTLSQLPRAVEVTLELEDMGRLTRLFSVPGERPLAAIPAGQTGTP